MEKEGVIISEGGRSIFQLVLASFFFTMGIILLLLYFFGINLFDLDNSYKKWIVGNFEIGLFAIVQGVVFSMVRSIHFDLKANKYKIVYSVGPISYGKWKELPEVNYVSVFRQPKSNGKYTFDVNLWYTNNRHFNVYENYIVEPSFDMGYQIAKSLNVDLLDATDPHNKKWIEIES
ncbi:hypothetical protein [Allomuricauda sp. NBRC 101325]|uniref:hypothetical protein n=1 Tax=Allomuricauda sp. NBRC 101325 TaxID=1113758 RepID=UPI0025579C55|nr:hypothetical protein [Muricauda sp. NBRC 101325]